MKYLGPEVCRASTFAEHLGGVLAACLPVSATTYRGVLAPATTSHTLAKQAALGELFTFFIIMYLLRPHNYPELISVETIPGQ